MHFLSALQRMLEHLEPPYGPFTLVPLVGDASVRRYFRLVSATGKPSLILMVLPDASPKASEEKVSGRQPDELLFVNLQRFLASVPLPVPAIYAYDEAAGLLLLEDYGDVTLEAWLQDQSDAAIEARYRQAISLLVTLQVQGTSRLTPACWASQEAFDAEVLRWELDHYYEYGVAATHGALDPAAYQVVDAAFSALVDRLLKLERVVVHRDFHSRNLLVDGDRLGIIDFQDALMGPALYDLASLLRDSYVTLPAPMVDRLLLYYRECWEAAGGNPLEADLAAWREQFDLVSLHRNLKAAGRFAYIDQVKKNPKFLASIPRTLGYVKENLSRYEWLHPLLEVLATKVPALKG